MKKYISENKILLIVIFLIVVLSGPTFSVLLYLLSEFLNRDFGDWLSFYGSIIGIVISALMIHFQMLAEKEREKTRFRPELAVENDYQLVKSGSRVYFNNKYWYYLEKKRLEKNGSEDDFVKSNSFELQYNNENRMDKALSIEILNAQPLFNLCIQFDDRSNHYERISRLSADEKIYVISKNHLEEHQNKWFGKEAKFTHVPQKLTFYYTTLVGEHVKSEYRVDINGYCHLEKQEYGIYYPKISNGNIVCDYFIKT